MDVRHGISFQSRVLPGSAVSIDAERNSLPVVPQLQHVDGGSANRDRNIPIRVSTRATLGAEPERLSASGLTFTDCRLRNSADEELSARRSRFESDRDRGSLQYRLHVHA